MIRAIIAASYAHYRTLFGPEQVHVRLYAEFRSDQLGFLRKFCADLGIDVDIGSLPIDKVNASLDPHRIRILRRLNLLTARSVQNKQVLMDLGGWYKRRWIWLDRIAGIWHASADTPTSLELPDDLGARMSELYGADNAKVAAEWNLAFCMHGTSRQHQLVSRAEGNVITLGVEDISCPLMATVVTGARSRAGAGEVLKKI